MRLDTRSHRTVQVQNTFARRMEIHLSIKSTRNLRARAPFTSSSPLSGFYFSVITRDSRVPGKTVKIDFAARYI